MENKGESDHCLEILENLEILEILEIPPVQKTPFVMTPFSGPDLSAIQNPTEFTELPCQCIFQRFPDFAHSPQILWSSVRSLCVLLLALELYINSRDFLGKVGQSQAKLAQKRLIFA